MDIKLHTLSSYLKITFKARTFEMELWYPFPFYTKRDHKHLGATNTQEYSSKQKALQLQFLLLGSKV